jgi:hypothetical protein
MMSHGMVIDDLRPLADFLTADACHVSELEKNEARKHVCSWRAAFANVCSSARDNWARRPSREALPHGRFLAGHSAEEHYRSIDDIARFYVGCLRTSQVLVIDGCARLPDFQGLMSLLGDRLSLLDLFVAPQDLSWTFVFLDSVQGVRCDFIDKGECAAD